MTTPTEYLNCPLEKITWFFSLFSQSPLGRREDKPGLLILIWLDLDYSLGGEGYYWGMETFHISRAQITL